MENTFEDTVYKIFGSIDAWDLNNFQYNMFKKMILDKNSKK